MARVPVKETSTFGLRLSRGDREKLDALCQAADMQACDVIRKLIRAGQPTHLPPVLLRAVEGVSDGDGTK